MKYEYKGRPDNESGCTMAFDRYHDRILSLESLQITAAFDGLSSYEMVGRQCLEHPFDHTRGDFIKWLTWNDRNGCYRDDDCDAEELPRLTHETAWRQMLEQITRDDEPATEEATDKPLADSEYDKTHDHVDECECAMCKPRPKVGSGPDDLAKGMYHVEEPFMQMTNREVADAERKQEYLDNCGLECPFCGSEDLSYDSYDHTDHIMTQPVSCDECGAEWINTHTLNDVEFVKRGNKANVS